MPEFCAGLFSEKGRPFSQKKEKESIITSLSIGEDLFILNLICVHGADGTSVILIITICTLICCNGCENWHLIVGIACRETRLYP